MTTASTISSHQLTTDQESTLLRSVPRTGARFLRHVHYFRAFAIVSILFAHQWDLPIGHEARPVLYTLRELLFHSSTVYFVFISGFLFIHLSAGFDIKRYYRSKLLYVVVPYALLSTLVFCIKHAASADPESAPRLLKELGLTLVQGTAVGPYWYIPFLVIIFMVSPLLLTLPPRAFRWLCILACPLPLLGTRTTSVTLPLFLYFFPVYLIGCLAAKDYRAFTDFVRDHRWTLLLAAAISTMLIAALGALPYSVGWVNVTHSLFYIQKLSTCLLVLVALQRWESRDARLPGTIASYSFALYFTHPVLFSTELRLRTFAWLPKVEWLVVVGSVALVLALLGLNLLACAAVKHVFGKRSRYLIGV